MYVPHELPVLVPGTQEILAASDHVKDSFVSIGKAPALGKGSWKPECVEMGHCT